MAYSSDLCYSSRLSFSGGHLIITPPSFIDPAAIQTFFVGCAKHVELKWFPLEIDLLDIRCISREELIDLAIKAIAERCPDCVYERQHKESRFPQDVAEL